jgi:hypothetical protein
MSQNVQLKLAVYRSQQRLNIINCNTLEEIECWGFDAQGKPILDPNRPCKYKFTGGHSGNVHLNYVFKRGLNPDNVRDPNSPQRVFEFKAVALQLSRNGAYADPQKIEKKTKKLIEEGVSIIHYVKLSSLLGMATIKNDEWLVTGKAEDPDYDLEWPNLLKKIGSEWRIATEKMTKAIGALFVKKTAHTSPQI